MLLVGDELHGFCDGYFGRDSYDNKRVEAVGSDWVVARDSRGDAVFATHPIIHKILAKSCPRLKKEE